MKSLKYIAIYYILLGIACLFIYSLFGLCRVSIVGVLLLFVYYILKHYYEIKEFPVKIPKAVSFLLTVFFVLLPFIVVIGIQLYYERPYKQIILLPDAYEGPVVLLYDKAKGQQKIWKDGYRIIKVDSNGLGCTQFKPEENRVGSLEGIKVYLRNDLTHELKVLYYDDKTMLSDSVNKKQAWYVVNFSDYRNEFIITSDYNKYFKPNTDNELKDELKKITDDISPK